METRAELRRVKKDADEVALDILKSLDADFGHKAGALQEELAKTRQEMCQVASQSRRMVREIELAIKEDHERQLRLIEARAREEQTRLRDRGF